MPEGPVGAPANENPDPTRIKPFVLALEKLWATTPELRFGDLVNQLVIRCRPHDLIDSSDVRVLALIKRLTEFQSSPEPVVTDTPTDSTKKKETP